MSYFMSLLDSGRFIDDLLYTSITVVILLLLLLIPLRVQSILTVPFSFRTFGIRKIRRWHSRTDTLANLMLWISIIFCILAPWIPYSPIIYLVWLILSWLSCVSRAIRLTKVTRRGPKLTVIFIIDLIFGIGLLSTLGFYNSYSLWIRSFMFANDIVSGEGLRFMYYLGSIQPGAYLLQTILLILPLASLWGQFKYMRLENTYKSSNLGFYICRNLLLIVVMALLALVGPTALEKIYNLPSEERISIHSKVYPLSREEVKDLTIDEAADESSSENSQPSSSDSALPSSQEQISTSDHGLTDQPQDHIENEATQRERDYEKAGIDLQADQDDSYTAPIEEIQEEPVPEAGQ